MRLASSDNMYNYGFYCLAIALATFSVYTVFSNAYYSCLSFDGAMNMQVATNLINSKGYAANYDGITLFDHRIQTGAPLLLLNAVLFSMLGTSTFTAQLPNCFYFLATTLLIYKLVQRFNNRWAGLLTVACFIATPGILNYGLRGYGEIVALFFIICALHIYKSLEDQNKGLKFQAFIIGTLFGLSYLTKTVSLIMLPTLCVVCLLDLIYFKKISFKNHLIIFLSMIVPLLFFEAYKSSALGFISYREWWIDELGNISAQAGVKKGFEDTSSLLEKTIKHFSILTSQYKLSPISMSLFLFLPYFLLIIQILRYLALHKLPKISLTLLTIAGVSLTYFSWWLAVTPTSKAWSRRILNGFVLHELLAIIIMACSWYVLQTYSNNDDDRFIVVTNLMHRTGAIILGFIITYSTVINMKNISVLHTYQQQRIGAEFVAKKISQLPAHAKIYGTGWWQAPVLSFISGRSFIDIKKADPKEFAPKDLNYFVTDPESYSVAKHEIQEVLQKADYNLVVINNNYALYKINLLRPFPPFNDTDKKGQLVSLVDFEKSDYEYVRGLYGYEGSFRWSQKQSGILLNSTGWKNFFLRIQIPDMGGYSANEVNLDVYFDDAKVKTFKISKAGDFEANFNVSSNISYKGPVTVKLSLDKNWRNHNNQDTRQLCFVLKSVGFTN